MFRTDSSSVTGKLTYSTIFQLAAEGLTEFSTQDFGAPQRTILTKCSSFLQTSNISPSQFGGVIHVKIHFCSPLVKIQTRPFFLKVFNQRLDKSFPVTTSSAAVILINSQVTVFPLHAWVSCEFNNYKSQSAKHSSQRGPHSLPVVPTSLWIHQYMSTISMWQ